MVENILYINFFLCNCYLWVLYLVRVRNIGIVFIFIIGFVVVNVVFISGFNLFIFIYNYSVLFVYFIVIFKIVEWIVKI